MKWKQPLPLHIGLISIVLSIWLVSCSGTTPISTVPSTPAPPATVTVPSVSQSGAGTVPQLMCDEAVQFIEQNQIKEVQLYYSKSSPDFLDLIFLIVRDSNQSSASPIPTALGGETDIGPTMDTKCPSRVLAAVKQVNKGLPKSMQVIVSKHTEFA